MLFTNPHKGVYLATAMSLLLLVGCGSTPKTPDETIGDLQQSPEGAEGGPQFSFDLSGPEQNPYLTQEVSVPGPAQALFNDGVRAMQAQQWSRAIILLQQLNREYPNLSGPYLNLGIAYRQLQQMDAAEQAFAQAVTVNAMNMDALNQLALLKREKGDFKAAETFYLEALSVWPRHPPSHKNIGILYDLYMGEFAKALDHFEVYQYLQAEPDRRIAGWIIDLQRRIENLQAGAQP